MLFEISLNGINRRSVCTSCRTFVYHANIYSNWYVTRDVNLEIFVTHWAMLQFMFASYFHYIYYFHVYLLLHTFIIIQSRMLHNATILYIIILIILQRKFGGSMWYQNFGSRQILASIFEENPPTSLFRSAARILRNFIWGQQSTLELTRGSRCRFFSSNLAWYAAVQSTLF